MDLQRPLQERFGLNAVSRITKNEGQICQAIREIWVFLTRCPAKTLHCTASELFRSNIVSSLPVQYAETI